MHVHDVCVCVCKFAFVWRWPKNKKLKWFPVAHGIKECTLKSTKKWRNEKNVIQPTRKRFVFSLVFKIQSTDSYNTQSTCAIEIIFFPNQNIRVKNVVKVPAVFSAHQPKTKLNKGSEVKKQRQPQSLK